MKKANSLNDIYSSLIENGYGQYSRDILDKTCQMVQEIIKATDEFKPQDMKIRFCFGKPNTNITVNIESPKFKCASKI